MLVSEAPGESENLDGNPFVGPAGHRLDDIVSRAIVQRCSVVNLREEPFDIKICSGTDWGNPFRIGTDGTREEVIEKYRLWLKRRPDLQSRLSELSDMVLGCFCAPEACHGDVLVEEVRKRYPSPTVGITNILGCIPWKENQRGVRPPTKVEAEACRPRLLEIIKLAKPKAIVCMGKEARSYLPKPKEGLPRDIIIEKTVHPAWLERLRSQDQIKYTENVRRMIVTLDRLKKRIWGL